MDKQTRYLYKLNDQLFNKYSKMMDSLWRMLTKEDETAFYDFEQSEVDYQAFLASLDLKQQFDYFTHKHSEMNLRQLEVLQNDSLEFRTSSIQLQKISELWNQLHALVSRFQVFVEGNRYSHTELFEILNNSTNISFREKIWYSFMQIGQDVEPGLKQLVLYRNEIAQKNGYDNFFEMKLRSQELSTSYVVGIIKELRRSLDPIYLSVKQEIDQELAQCFHINVEDIRPWHYEHPFFQYFSVQGFLEHDVDLEFIKKRILNWFQQRNVDLESILLKADLQVSPEKSQASFCLNIDRGQDIRLSCHFGSDFQSLKILLHELGHAFYEKNIDHSLPFILRQPHIFISEAIALLFERLPIFTSDKDTLFSPLRDRERESINQLVRLYWTMVVVEFERSMYEDPSQDLTALWWGLVEEIQLIDRPVHWDTIPAWAAKAHLTTLPVYYQNYLLGEVLASQFEVELTRTFNAWWCEKSLNYLSNSILRPGKARDWRDLIKQFPLKKLSAKDYISQIKTGLGYTHG